MKKKLKPWEGKKKNRKRKEDTRPLKDIFLIFCEGTKTEPNYFEAFPISKSVINVDVRGKGFNTLSLVNKAIEERAVLIKNQGNIIVQTWCVFDRDSFPLENYNKAFILASNNNIRIAYSNEAFELWYLLHYNYHNTASSRDQYEKMLSERLGFRYEKNNPEMYYIIKDKQFTAIANAKRLMSIYPKFNPEQSNPSTTVYKLVEVLNEFIE